jgi:hypothetical protein
VIPSKLANFLDLNISLCPDGLRIRTHQKEVNAYLYPHWNSNIPQSIKKGFIKGELIRYARNSSLLFSFSFTKQCFFARLLSRGYSYHYLERISRSVCFAMRQELLDGPVNNRNNHPPPPPSHPPPQPLVFSASQQQHILQQPWQQLPAQLAPIPLYFKVTFDQRLKLHQQIKKIFTEAWPLLPPAFRRRFPLPPLMCHLLQPSLQQFVVKADHKTTTVARDTDTLLSISLLSDDFFSSPNDPISPTIPSALELPTSTPNRGTPIEKRSTSDADLTQDGNPASAKRPTPTPSPTSSFPTANTLPQPSPSPVNSPEPEIQLEQRPKRRRTNWLRKDQGH